MDNNQLKKIKALIREKSKPQLCDLIIDLCKRFPDSFEQVLMWGKSANGVNINEELALEYWRKAEAIYLNVLKDATRWENKLAEIRERYKKRRAFLEESAVLD
ncbi:MAG: hypothetical protein FWG61_07960 [Firmicutes bacterium]|nr:hypothetical protein [Bacillota bacterium]